MEEGKKGKDMEAGSGEEATRQLKKKKGGKCKKICKKFCKKEKTPGCMEKCKEKCNKNGDNKKPKKDGV